MRFHRLPLALLALTTSLGLGACTDEDENDLEPLEPVPADVYVVQTVEGAALPAVVHTVPPIENDPRTYHVYVVYDTVRLIWNGRYERRARIETRDENGVFYGHALRNDRGSWQADGNSFHFTSSYYEHVTFDGLRGDNGATLVSDHDLAWNDESTPKRFVYTRR